MVKKQEREIKRICTAVLKKVKPRKAISSKVDKVVSNINEIIRSRGIKAECVKGGSIAKGTFLKKDYDVDLFVRFDKKYDSKKLSDLLEATLEQYSSVRALRVHGSRDYFQFSKYGLNFEVVPVLKVKNYKEAKIVTDMSPLHVGWVKKHNKGIVDEIRLAKQFCKAFRVYGAESYIRGFSGHVLDILVIHYKGFLGLLKAASEWKPKVIIDPARYYKKGSALKKLNKAKTAGPLIVVDPIQRDRNAAAALSYKMFYRFTEGVRAFLEKPKASFFEIKGIDVKKLKRMLEPNALVCLNVRALEGKRDVVGSKLLKVFTYIKKQCNFHEFIVEGADWDFDGKNATFYYIFKPKKLSETKLWIGPPVNQNTAVENFKKKYKDVFQCDGRVCTELKREYMKPKELIKALIKEQYVKERVKSIRCH